MGEIDWPAAAPSLVSNQSILLHRANIRAFRKVVSVLLPYEAILIEGQSYSIVKRKFFLSEEEKKQFNYGDLIKKGIERAVSEIHAACAVSRARPTIGLSGGRDSRTVLALLFAAGKQREVDVVANDPLQYPAGATRDTLEGDLSVSTRIVERFELSWKQRTPVKSERLSVRAHIDRFQNQRSNQSFEIHSNTLVSDYGGVVDFYGAGGEMYRGYFALKHKKSYPRWNASLANPGHEPREECRELFRALVHPTLLPKQMYKESEEAFAETLLKGSDGTRSSYELLDKFYVTQRSRTHHSVVRQSLQMGKILSTPLCQKEFFFANQLLSDQERQEGKVQFDIIEHAEPLLNEISFFNDRWSSELLPEDRLEGNNWQAYDGLSARKAWRESLRSKPDVIEGRAPFDVVEEFRKELDRRGDRLNDVFLWMSSKTSQCCLDFQGDNCLRKRPR